MKSQIPRRIPGILPFIGHGDDVAVQHVEPLSVANVPFTGPQQRVGIMFGEPFVEIEIVILLAPQHALPTPGDAFAVHLRPGIQE